MLAKWGVHFEVQESRASQLLHQIGLPIVGPAKPSSLDWVEPGVRFPKVEFEFFCDSARVSSREFGRITNNHAGRPTRICFLCVGKTMQLQYD